MNYVTKRDGKLEIMVLKLINITPRREGAVNRKQLVSLSLSAITRKAVIKKKPRLYRLQMTLISSIDAIIGTTLDTSRYCINMTMT